MFEINKGGKCMSGNIKKYELYRDFLVNELIRIDSMFELFVYLKNQHQKRLDILNISPVFFGLTENSLYECSLIWLCRIYDCNNNTITISKYLGYLEQNAKQLFKPNEYTEIKKMISEDQQKLKNYAGIILELKKIRDKTLVHNDMCKLESGYDIFSDAGLLIKDIRDLIQFGINCINNYSKYYDKNIFSVKAHNNLDVEAILDILEKSDRIQNNRARITHKPR